MAGGTNPWSNGAAWPSDRQSPSNPQQSQRDHLHLNMLRGRYLTHGGTRVNLTVPITSTTLAVAFTTPEPDLLYGVVATPSWSTTVFVASASKAVTGFTLSFGTAAPAAETVDLTVFRTES